MLYWGPSGGRHNPPLSRMAHKPSPDGDCLSWKCLPCPLGYASCTSMGNSQPGHVQGRGAGSAAGEVGMKTRGLWLMAAISMVALAGCADLGVTAVGGGKLLSGQLLETTTASGHVLRLMAQELEGWDHYDRNPRKGDGDACILKAEARF